MKPILIAIAVMLIFGLIGNNDYEDEKAEIARYCEKVKDGHWFDSEENFKRKCKPSVDS